MARGYGDVVRQLLDAIAGGEYPEGSPLPNEAVLRLRLGCGRDVVRQALRALQERGLIVVQSGRGSAVLPRERWDTRDPAVLRACIARGPDPAILADTIAARAAIECEAVRQMLEREPEADLDHLRDQVEVMREALEPHAQTTGAARERIVVADAWFHHMLVGLSANAQLAKLVEPWHLLLADRRRVRAPARDGAVVAHHRRILEGLSSREEDLAVGAISTYADQLVRWIGTRR